MTNYLNVKSGIEILHSNGTTQILAGELDPSLTGVTASKGSIFLSSLENGALYLKTSDNDTGWVATSSNALTVDEYIDLENREKFIELTYDQGRVSVIDEWLDETKTYKISSTAIFRTNGLVSKTEKDIYDYLTGTSVIATVTGTVNRTDNKVQSITYSK